MPTEINKSLKSNILKMDLIDWQKLQFIQHDTFKEWFNDGDLKLMESLLKFQFIDPFKVWENDGKQYCLDGKHRCDDLLKAKQMDIDVPDMLPAVFIYCKDKKEAAELVLVYSSAYAKISQQGFYDFLKINKLQYEGLGGFVNIPNLDITNMNDWFLPQPDDNELIGLAKHNPLTIKITFKIKEQFNTGEYLIKQLLQQHCPGAFYSVGGGEL